MIFFFFDLTSQLLRERCTLERDLRPRGLTKASSAVCILTIDVTKTSHTRTLELLFHSLASSFKHEAFFFRANQKFILSVLPQTYSFSPPQADSFLFTSPLLTQPHCRRYHYFSFHPAISLSLPLPPSLCLSCWLSLISSRCGSCIPLVGGEGRREEESWVGGGLVSK